MSLDPERREYYQKRLNQLLQNAIQHIRIYHNDLTTLKCPRLIEQAQNLWELSQRQRLVSSSNASAGRLLLAACQDIFTSIHETILQLTEDLTELAKDVRDFHRERLSLEAELNEECNPLLIDWSTWLEKTLTVLQTQAKYLELNTRSMLPRQIDNSIVEQFTKDLQLPENYVASIYIGLAKAELKPLMLLPAS